MSIGATGRTVGDRGASQQRTLERLGWLEPPLIQDILVASAPATPAAAGESDDHTPHVTDASVRMEVMDRVEELLVRLCSLQSAREGLQLFGSLRPTGRAYSGLLRQVFEQMFDARQPALPDLVPVGTKMQQLKSAVTTSVSNMFGGWGFGAVASAVGISKAKPRPVDKPLLVVFVIGGVTGEEVAAISQALEAAAAAAEESGGELVCRNVLVGSNKIATGRGAYSSVLCRGLDHSEFGPAAIP